MTHDHCTFCKPETDTKYTCDVCGADFFGRHFHFYKFNFCSTVCSVAMREHTDRVEEERRKKLECAIGYIVSPH